MADGITDNLNPTGKIPLAMGAIGRNEPRNHYPKMNQAAASGRVALNPGSKRPRPPATSRVSEGSGRAQGRSKPRGR